ncbi:hypothetical protein GCM10010357_55740 [Streptomyces luteireticuli]|uniref:Uncharacterized protein n=1 Tax=Streptomyces luteireticuli TaxID=173858 RepID=A0ABN0Z112_9ACTN
MCHRHWMYVTDVHDIYEKRPASDPPTGRSGALFVPERIPPTGSVRESVRTGRPVLRTRSAGTTYGREGRSKLPGYVPRPRVAGPSPKTIQHCLVRPIHPRNGYPGIAVI